jgi:hypothetical protein
MLNLQQGKPIAERLRPEVEHYTWTDVFTGPDTPMACEPYVAYAVCHLLSGFLIVENLAATSRPVSGSSTPLECSSKNIATVMKELNDCSVGFWLMPRAPDPAVTRLRGICGAYKRRGRAPEASGEAVKAADGPVEVKSSHASDHQAEPVAGTRSEWGNSLALAILHLVGAYTAMEPLSESSFPAGAPESFELACHCLCDALVTLDACLADCSG